MKIEIDSISHDMQRYKTIGDWYQVLRVVPLPAKELLSIRVSKMEDENHMFLVALHELVEAWWCRNNGVKTTQVDEFDMSWQGEGEPGDDPAAPYYAGHQFASRIERMMADELGVDWAEYNTVCEEVYHS